MRLTPRTRGILGPADPGSLAVHDGLLFAGWLTHADHSWFAFTPNAQLYGEYSSLIEAIRALPDSVRMNAPISAITIQLDRCTPVLMLCRQLLSAGYDPRTRLEIFRDNQIALRVRSIAEGACLEVASQRRRIQICQTEGSKQMTSTEIAIRNFAVMFGGCPHCGGHNGYVNVHREHWMYLHGTQSEMVHRRQPVQLLALPNRG